MIVQSLAGSQCGVSNLLSLNKCMTMCVHLCRMLQIRGMYAQECVTHRQ